MVNSTHPLFPLDGRWADVAMGTLTIWAPSSPGDPMEPACAASAAFTALTAF
jgi:hypothetical protein